MATFRQRGKSWTAQVKLPGGATRSKSFPTRPLAERWARDVETQRDRGTLRDPHLDQVTVAEIWESYAKIRRAVRARNTVVREETHWRIHVQPTFGATPVAGLNPLAVEAWVAEQADAGVGSPTLEKCVQLLHALCTSAIRAGVITHNPVAGIAIPAHQPRHRTFVTRAEVDAILGEVQAPAEWLLIALLAGTGLRPQEGLGLAAAHVARDGSTVSIHQVWTRHGIKMVPKTKGSVRTVPVPQHLRPALREHVRMLLPRTLLFPGLDDRNVNRRVLGPACEAAGVQTITLNELRHHAASVWIAAGVPLFEVAKALGHSSTRMVERHYGHLTPGAHDRLLAAWADTRG